MRSLDLNREYLFLSGLFSWHTDGVFVPLVCSLKNSHKQTNNKKNVSEVNACFCASTKNCIVIGMVTNTSAELELFLHQDFYSSRGVDQLALELKNKFQHLNVNVKMLVKQLIFHKSCQT